MIHGDDHYFKHVIVINQNSLYWPTPLAQFNGLALVKSRARRNVSYLTDDNSNENLLGCGYGVIYANISAAKLYRKEARKKKQAEAQKISAWEKSILFIVKSECGHSGWQWNGR